MQRTSPVSFSPMTSSRYRNSGGSAGAKLSDSNGVASASGSKSFIASSARLTNHSW